MPTRRELIMEAKNAPATDILVPLQTEEKDLTPYPGMEYDVLFHTSLDKLIKDVNRKIEQGWQTEGGIQVVTNGTSSRFYQSIIRWNVDLDEKPEMPSRNSEAGTMGPKPLYIPGLEDEPDLYEDIEKDVDE